MKDFIEDIKDGFDVLPKILSFAIIIGLLSMIFFGLDGFLWSLVGILGGWAVIFILLPFVVLVLDGINYLFDKIDKWNKNPPKKKKDFESI